MRRSLYLIVFLVIAVTTVHAQPVSALKKRLVAADSALASYFKNQLLLEDERITAYFKMKYDYLKQLDLLNRNVSDCNNLADQIKILRRQLTNDIREILGQEKYETYKVFIKNKSQLSGTEPTFILAED